MSPSRRALRRAVIFGVGTTLAGIAACGGDDNGAPNSFAGTPGPDATVVGTDAGTDAPTTAVLCGKYGGNAYVQKLSTDLVALLAADCRIDFYFPAGTDSTTHFSECLTKQLGTFFQCPGVAYDKDSKGNTCRSMAQAHQGLDLRSADFSAFVDDVVAAMQADGMSSDDIQGLIPTFLGLQGQIVSKQGKGESQCTCPGLVYDGGSCALEYDAGDGGDADSSTDATSATDTGGGTDTGSGADAADSASDDASGE